LLALIVQLYGCDSRSPPTQLALAPRIAANANSLQIVPAQQPEFDLTIHDYVVDCSAGSVDLSVAQPEASGFVWLGTTTRPIGATIRDVIGMSQQQFRRTVRLAPGHAFRFAFAGHHPYSVRCLPSGFPPLSVSTSGTPQEQWYIFAPDITGGGDYVIITDAHGTPVWWLQEPGLEPIDAKVLDSNHITWTHVASSGSYYIRDFNGQIVNTLAADLDIHDLQPTGTGTYFSIRYVQRECPPDCADMSPWGGSAQMSVTDGEIVELDANSNILWSWNTRDHIALSEAGATGWFAGRGGDIIHMNAVEPDGTDAVLFSARHLNAIYRVIKSTGAIDWKIGGTVRPESLTVIGDVRPTAVGPNGQVLRGQHDVRRWADGTISVHDNGTLAGRPPSIMRYRLDLTNRTAEVVQEIHDERVTDSPCCGSARLLSDGHWLVEWGGAPFTTELDSTGTPVLTINYNEGSAFSYRAVGVPSGIVSTTTLWAGMDAMYGNSPVSDSPNSPVAR